jgi:DNA-binding MarR family transcriptional regulator
VEPTRVRTLPAHFAWIDHRLRERLRDLSLAEMALLFFLHLAADRTGCSFWADATIARKLGVREGDILQARDRLVAQGLVAYRYPLYQLLPLEDPR